MTKGIEINTIDTRLNSCNCCSYTEKTDQLYEITFPLKGSGMLVKLCKKHLKELRNEIDKQ